MNSQPVEDNKDNSTASDFAKVMSVIVITTAPLLPFKNTYDRIDPLNFLNWSYKVAKEASSVSNGSRISEADAKRLLKTLAKWQQDSRDRAVLLVGNSDTSFCIKAVVSPLTMNNHSEELVSEEQLDLPENISFNIWNKERSRMQSLLIGSISERSRVILPNPAGLPEKTSDYGTKYSRLEFRSEFDLESVSARRSFWDVRSVPFAFPKHLLDGSIIPEVPASFSLRCVTDISRQKESALNMDRSSLSRVILGPIIFKVTSSSAVVMVEVSYSGQVEVLCVDQLSGEEFICIKFATAKRPCFFHFNELRPNHSYDVTIADAFEFDNESDFWTSPIASFSTHRRIIVSEEDEEAEREENMEIDQLRAAANSNQSQTEIKSPVDARSIDSSGPKSFMSASLTKSIDTKNEMSNPLGIQKKKKSPFRIIAVG